jgi:hypothetical protein
METRLFVRVLRHVERSAGWLEPYAAKHPPFTFTNFQRDFAAVKNAAGFNGKEGAKGLRPWVPDYMRHPSPSAALA